MESVHCVVKRISSDEHGEAQITLRVPATEAEQIVPMLMAAQRNNDVLIASFVREKDVPGGEAVEV